MAAFDSPLQRIENMLKGIVGEISGTDTDDRMYDSIQELWKYELNTTKDDPDWYEKANNYWEDEENCPITDDGVLQGYGRLTEPDVRASNIFLDNVLKLRPGLELKRAADCGAGIGRVTKHFLLNRFEKVDLIEQSARLLASSAVYIGEESIRTTCVNIGLQNFEPAPNSYDVIWIQWVIGHVHDVDCIRFLERCAAGLTSNGVIILKDNAAEGWTFVVDKEDSSLSRSPEYIVLLAELAGLKSILREKQTGFPEELFPVLMIAFIPNEESTKRKIT
mmetsp:Transcript_5527/g.5703  ORF Transcript_5527/g.5703 Transcript_5527/m.5703 type:complete len:277 (-) Transcript_5527:60-890(-)|eukprot:CAMPEP_0182430176 /NCGR_PEP_ID=MMETSP1167-20130531/37969_1 /TAXON_ID=2988 /ORGANISM="Mallomonas Sp, Strain CCMP3275" /LENGTH=276 /DNA_ID=CAMNT_0024614969 /DNA_START=64 /DNA_END=894 /DNA_ORIENTATION=+